MWQNPQFPEDLVTFTEEMLNGKLFFLGSAISPSLTIINILFQKMKSKITVYGKKIPYGYIYICKRFCWSENATAHKTDKVLKL